MFCVSGSKKCPVILVDTPSPNSRAAKKKSCRAAASQGSYTSATDNEFQSSAVELVKELKTVPLFPSTSPQPCCSASTSQSSSDSNSKNISSDKQIPASESSGLGHIANKSILNGGILGSGETSESSQHVMPYHLRRKYSWIQLKSSSSSSNNQHSSKYRSLLSLATSQSNIANGQIEKLYASPLNTSNSIETIRVALNESIQSQSSSNVRFVNECSVPLVVENSAVTATDLSTAPSPNTPSTPGPSPHLVLPPAVLPVGINSDTLTTKPTISKNPFANSTYINLSAGASEQAKSSVKDIKPIYLFGEFSGEMTSPPAGSSKRKSPDDDSSSSSSSSSQASSSPTNSTATTSVSNSNSSTNNNSSSSNCKSNGGVHPTSAAALSSLLVAADSSIIASSTTSSLQQAGFSLPLLSKITITPSCSSSTAHLTISTPSTSAAAPASPFSLASVSSLSPSMLPARKRPRRTYASNSNDVAGSCEGYISL